MKQLSEFYPKNEMINSQGVIIIKHVNAWNQVTPYKRVFLICVQLASCRLYDFWYLPKAINHFSECKFMVTLERSSQVLVDYSRTAVLLMWTEIIGKKWPEAKKYTNTVSLYNILVSKSLCFLLRKSSHFPVSFLIVNPCESFGSVIALVIFYRLHCSCTHAYFCAG